MKIVVTANGADLDAPSSPIFGRCATYLLVDTESMQVQALANPALSASGGAGVQAAQYVIAQGAQAVVTGNVGPNAFNVFQAAGVPVYQFAVGTVRQAIQAYTGGQLSPISGATVTAHAGTGRAGHRGRNT